MIAFAVSFRPEPLNRLMRQVLAYFGVSHIHVGESVDIIAVGMEWTPKHPSSWRVRCQIAFVGTSTTTEPAAIADWYR